MLLAHPVRKMRGAAPARRSHSMADPSARAGGGAFQGTNGLHGTPENSSPMSRDGSSDEVALVKGPSSSSMNEGPKSRTRPPAPAGATANGRLHSLLSAALCDEKGYTLHIGNDSPGACDFACGDGDSAHEANISATHISGFGGKSTSTHLHDEHESRIGRVTPSASGLNGSSSDGGRRGCGCGSSNHPSAAGSSTSASELRSSLLCAELDAVDDALRIARLKQAALEALLSAMGSETDALARKWQREKDLRDSRRVAEERLRRERSASQSQTMVSRQWSAPPVPQLKLARTNSVFLTPGLGHEGAPRRVSSMPSWQNELPVEATPAPAARGRTREREAQGPGVHVHVSIVFGSFAGEFHLSLIMVCASERVEEEVPGSGTASSTALTPSPWAAALAASTGQFGVHDAPLTFLYEQLSGIGSSRRLPGLAPPLVLDFNQPSDLVTRPLKPELSIASGGPKVSSDYREWAEPLYGGLVLTSAVMNEHERQVTASRPFGGRRVAVSAATCESAAVAWWRAPDADEATWHAFCQDAGAVPGWEPCASGSRLSSRTSFTRGGSSDSVSSASSSRRDGRTSATAKTHVIAALSRHPLLSRASREELLAAAACMRRCAYKQGDVVVYQSCREDKFYVVDSGRFDAFIYEAGTAAVREYRRGDAFAPMALVCASEQQSTIICQEDGCLWQLPCHSFQAAVVLGNEQRFASTCRMLRRVHCLRGLPSARIASLVPMTSELVLLPGAPLRKRGAIPPGAYLVCAGSLVRSVPYNGESGEEGETVAPTYGAGDCYIHGVLHTETPQALAGVGETSVFAGSMGRLPIPPGACVTKLPATAATTAARTTAAGAMGAAAAAGAVGAGTGAAATVAAATRAAHSGAQVEDAEVFALDGGARVLFLPQSALQEACDAASWHRRVSAGQAVAHGSAWLRKLQEAAPVLGAEHTTELQRQQLIDAFSILTFRAGEDLVREGEPPPGLLLLLAGTVSIEPCRAVREALGAESSENDAQLFGSEAESGAEHKAGRRRRRQGEQAALRDVCAVCLAAPSLALRGGCGNGSGRGGGGGSSSSRSIDSSDDVSDGQRSNGGGVSGGQRSNGGGVSNSGRGDGDSEDACGHHARVDPGGSVGALSSACCSHTARAMSACSAVLLPLRSAMLILASSHEFRQNALQPRVDTPRGRELHAPAQLSELQIEGFLGEGSTSKVLLARLTRNPAAGEFALKCIPKEPLLAARRAMQVVRERRALRACGAHPGLPRILGAYQDSLQLFLLLEAVLGLELFYLLREAHRFDAPTATFYAAIAVSTIAHMHAHSWVHRDIKPENALVDSAGYLVLVDFGSCVRVKHGTERAWTICGTPEYTAPEVLSCHGYGCEVDYWALGVLLFEMLAGFSPFCDDKPINIYKRVLEADYAFPNHFSGPCRDAVSQLLNTNPSQRLGAAQRGVDIASHRLFDGLDWTALYARELPSPVVPVINPADPIDLASIEDILDLQSPRAARQPSSQSDPFTAYFTDFEHVVSSPVVASPPASPVATIRQITPRDGAHEAP